MGTFAGYYGKMTIPKERRQELSERMLKLFMQGGMMELEEVRIAGIKLSLLCLPKIDEEGYICVSYNYFEESGWETASFDVNKFSLLSGKVGYQHFNRVILAAYILMEFYSDTFAIAEVDGDVFDGTRFIGWINYLFAESYTNKRVYDLWEIYKLLPDYRKDLDLVSIAGNDTTEYRSCFGDLNYLCVTQFDDFKRVADKHIDDKREDDQVTLGDLIWKLQDALKKISEKPAETEEKLSMLKKIIAAKLPDCFDLTEDADYRAFIISQKLLPLEMVLMFVADAFQVDFWEFYEEMLPLVPEAISPIPGKEKPFQGKEKPFPAVEPVLTKEFLLCSDDERAYFWKPEGDVVFSEGMEQWMVGLKKELDEIISDDGQSIPVTEFFMTFTKTLEAANKMYKRIYAFSDMFMEFIGHADRREYQAAVLLLQRLMERHNDEVEQLEQARWASELKFPGRMEIKKYLAILANDKLRQKVFGF